MPRLSGMNRPRDSHQPLPALVLSADVRNRLRDHSVVIPIYSRGRLGPTRVTLSAGVGGIGQDSVLFCDEITTIDHNFLAEGPLGPRLAREPLDDVLRAVRRALGDVVPE